MNRRCEKCGAQLAPEDLFCADCGTKCESSAITPADTPKKKLTNAVIDQELHNQKHSVGEYVGHFLVLALMFVVTALGAPGILLCAIPWALVLLRMIRHDVRRKKMKYYVLERPCIEKKFVEGDEGPDVWQLWFANMTGELFVALSVEQEFFDATEEGEEFYVVFLYEDKTPCICYRKSEWTK